jgi:hypothetical protein
MGVIGWPPRTVLHDASLRDLYEAYAARHRADKPEAGAGLPPQDFMRRMLAQYPDHPAGKPPAGKDEKP